jgi:hypothetical protein
MDDSHLMGNMKFDPSTIQDTLEILRSRSFSRFRYLLQNFSIKQVAIIILKNNELLNQRINLHLSEKTKALVSNYIRLNDSMITKNQISSEIEWIDFEMHVS